MSGVTEDEAEFGDLVASEPVAARVVAVIAPTIADLGFDLVRVQYGGAPATLQVMVEPGDLSDLGVDACADISRTVSALLDVADPINGKYMLEVSSPESTGHLPVPAISAVSPAMRLKSNCARRLTAANAFAASWSALKRARFCWPSMSAPSAWPGRWWLRHAWF